QRQKVHVLFICRLEWLQRRIFRPSSSTYNARNPQTCSVARTSGDTQIKDAMFTHFAAIFASCPSRRSFVVFRIVARTRNIEAAGRL
ncbi:unnamed protein product, partial [Aphanomyces euteiches]